MVGVFKSASAACGLVAGAQCPGGASAQGNSPEVSVEFISGVSRAGAGAALVGMPDGAGIGWRAKAQQRQRYRDYVEEAVREGLEQSPWESVREQVVLGGAQFLRQLKKHITGDRQEQRGARRLMAERPTFAAVVAAVEKLKGRKWAEFRDEYGDTGRDMALYLGRRVCGMKLLELAREAAMNKIGRAEV